MKVKKIKCVLNETSLKKYTTDKIAKSTSAASKKIFRNARANGNIKKVVIKGRGNRKGYGYGGVDVVVTRKKKYLLLPGKKHIETIDNAYLSNTIHDIQLDIRKLYKKCKKNLGLIKTPKQPQ